MIDLLENSNNIKDRVEYTKRLKEYIELTKSRIKTLEDDQETLKTEKILLKKLQDRLDQYDVYNQKPTHRCLTCQEVECACHVLKYNLDI